MQNEIPLHLKKKLNGKTATIYVPDRVSNFKRPKNATVKPHKLLSDGHKDIQRVRKQWSEFAKKLCWALELAGVSVTLLSKKMWEISIEEVANDRADLIFIPHHNRTTFPVKSGAIHFYMQTQYPALFTIDQFGWGPSASSYPISPARFEHMLPPDENPHWNKIRKKIIDRKTTKYKQPASNRHFAVNARHQDFAGPYIFIPAQVPYDEVIKQHSTVGMLEMVEKVASWCAQNGKRLIVKPHPMKKQFQSEVIERAKAPNIEWSNANIHDLLEGASHVFTINSGVGFEAILHRKPVVTFGKADYDCVTYPGDIHNLDMTWKKGKAYWTKQNQINAEKFAYWYLTHYLLNIGIDKCPPELRVEKFAVPALSRLAVT